MSKNLTTALCSEKKKQLFGEKKTIKNAKITNGLMLVKVTQVPAMMKF